MHPVISPPAATAAACRLPPPPPPPPPLLLLCSGWCRHLGSFYNDSEKYGGSTSSPITHGFDHFNATVEVAPTLSTNCQCKQEWSEECDLGHYKVPTHCSRDKPPGTSPTGWHPNPGGGNLTDGCCFNYWWEDASAEHGVQNLTQATPLDDSLYLAEAFEGFLESRGDHQSVT
jgi:hypothetical protein